MTANFQRMSMELIMSCSTSALLFAISRHASTRPTVGMVCLFHLREATHNPFLLRVLHLTPGYLLQLLPKHQLLLRIQTFMKSDPFSVEDKKGERDSMELSWLFLFIYFFIFGHVVFGGHFFFHCSTYFVV